MNVLAVLVILLSSGIPPLTDDDRGLLETAYDGRNHEEPAFWGLLQNTAGWTGEVGDAAIRVSPDFAAMTARPEEYRGDLCRIAGRIETKQSLTPPYEGIDAWFLRVESGRPVLVYVDFRSRGEDATSFQAGDRISMTARFYKRYDDTDVQGNARLYPAFVGAWPRKEVVTITAAADGFALLITLLVVGLALVFLAIIILTRRGRAPRAGRFCPVDAAIADEVDRATIETGLPHDPASALEILKHRAETEA